MIQTSRKLWIPLLVACLIVTGLVVRLCLPASFGARLSSLRRQASVADRQAQYGSAVRARLKPHFHQAGIAYPPTRLTFAAFKQERRLDVYAGNPTGPMRYLCSYPILAASGKLGPKLREGDRQVPEGVYRIESLNPNSAYHLSLRVNYPGKADRQQARRDGRDASVLGSDIMIHGSHVSIGCLAMGDPASEDLFILADDTGLSNITVLLCPVDFRTKPTYTDSRPWVRTRYAQLKTALQSLPVPSTR